MSGTQSQRPDPSLSTEQSSVKPGRTQDNSQRLAALIGRWPHLFRMQGHESCVPRAMMALGDVQATFLTTPEKMTFSTHEMGEIANALEITCGEWLCGTERLGLLPVRQSGDPTDRRLRVNRLCGIESALKDAAMILRSISQAMTPHFTPLSFLRDGQVEATVVNLARTMCDVLGPIDQAATLFASQDLEEREMTEIETTALSIIRACR